jgi:hypothetical protein
LSRIDVALLIAGATFSGRSGCALRCRFTDQQAQGHAENLGALCSTAGTGFQHAIFDNIKNLLVCALLFAAGTSALRADYQQFIGVLVAGATGWGLIGVSAVLMFLNVSDGIRRLGKLRYHVAIQVLVSLVYLLIAARLVEVVWAFRAA